MSNYFTSDAILESIDGSVRDTMSLMIFERKVWRAFPSDDQAKTLLAQSTGADKKALRTSKYLFEGTSRHEALLKAGNDAYSAFHRLTRPLPPIGRVLPNAAYGEFMAEMDPLIEEHDRKLQDFLDHYDEDSQTGAAHLGQLGKVYEYPPVEEVRKRFSVSYCPAPLPAKDLGVVADPQQLTRLQMNLESRLRASAQELFQEALDDLRQSCASLRERLETRLIAAPSESGKKPRVRLTSSALAAPATIARTLRRFARGEQAERFLKLENALETTLLETKGIGTDPKATQQAIKLLQFVEQL